MNTDIVGYNVNIQKASQLLISGLTATIVMVGFCYLLRLLGIPSVDFGAQYGAIVNNQIHPMAFTPVWWLGIIWHAVNGIFIFPLLFDYLAHRTILTNRRKVKGLVYGFGIWVLVGLVVAPLAGEGVFVRLMPDPVVLALTMLAAWLLYGLTLEGMTRVRAAHYLNLSEKAAA